MQGCQVRRGPELDEKTFKNFKKFLRTKNSAGKIKGQIPCFGKLV